MLGCSYDEARKHIELKFKDGMNWGNYGSVWEIDQIEPIGCANSEEELYILCNHKNLQPLFKEENKKKAKPEYKTRNKQKYKANNIR